MDDRGASTACLWVQDERERDPNFVSDAYAECYPAFHDFGNTVVDSDDEDLTHMDTKALTLTPQLNRACGYNSCCCRYSCSIGSPNASLSPHSSHALTPSMRTTCSLSVMVIQLHTHPSRAQLLAEGFLRQMVLQLGGDR